MTRVLIIGSSHVGAYKNATPAFAQLYPEVAVDFFGVRGPLFLSGAFDGAGIFTPAFRNDADRDFVQQTNGQLTADATDADHLVMLGHRFALHPVIGLMEEHDIMGRAQTGRPRLISELFLRDAITALVTEAVDKAASALAPFGACATFVTAPYPATSITQRAPDYVLARKLEQFWTHPDAAWVFDLWAEQLRRALGAHGHRLLMQPDMLNAAPYGTKPVYAQRAAHLTQEKQMKTDHRHMNADYGLVMLRALAETTLNLTSPDTPEREDA